MPKHTHQHLDGLRDKQCVAANAFKWSYPWVFKPTQKLIGLIAFWSLLAVFLLLTRLALGPAASIITMAVVLWWVMGLGLCFWCMLDIRLQHLLHAPLMTRQVSDSLSVGSAHTVTLWFEHNARQKLSISVYDHFCGKLICKGQMPIQAELLRAKRTSITYTIEPHARGDAQFTGCEVWVLSPSALWERRFWFDLSKVVRIYPNFSAVAKANTVDFENHLSQLGVHLQQQRGAGLDFKQLRAFQVGDSLRQVDWKATSRRRKPIVREFQDERGQDIIFMLDCGRAMRAKEQALSHFDAALNALLLSAYTALRQGDRVGLQAFAGQNLWQPPLTGHVAVNTLLHRVYDLECTSAAQDYLVAAQTLLMHHRKRAMIMLMTNLRMGMGDNLLNACRLLAKRHLVCVMSLKEEAVESLVLNPVNTLQEAVSVSSAVGLLSQHDQYLKRLRHQGVIAVESSPRMLHQAMIRQYQILKRSGRV